MVLWTTDCGQRDLTWFLGDYFSDCFRLFQNTFVPENFSQRNVWSFPEVMFLAIRCNCAFCSVMIFSCTVPPVEPGSSGADRYHRYRSTRVLVAPTWCTPTRIKARVPPPCGLVPTRSLCLSLASTARDPRTSLGRQGRSGTTDEPRSPGPDRYHRTKGIG